MIFIFFMPRLTAYDVCLSSRVATDELQFISYEDVKNPMLDLVFNGLLRLDKTFKVCKAFSFIPFYPNRCRSCLPYRTYLCGLLMEPSRVE